jgi:PKD repeat protein
MRSRAILVVLALCVAPLLLPAQEVPSVPIPVHGQITSYSHSAAPLTNATGQMQEMESHLVSVPGAPSIRVFFAETALGAGDYIQVAGVYNAEVHQLTPSELAKWQHSSAYFNGDAVMVSLHVAPGSTASYSISHLLTGIPVWGTDTLCGPDDRVASTDNRAARFLSNSGGGCTGWLIGADSCAASAGHCFSSGMAVAEFNVPPSNPSGSIVHPPVVDQFPIDQNSVVYTDGGQGNDFGVCHILTNNLGQTPATLYGYFNLGFFVPNVNDTIRITGFGVDDGVQNQTNQTSTGPYVTTNGTSIRYATDTMGGNSGSPVIDEASGMAVGIHTHGGCSSTVGSSNSGTSLTNTGFIAAYNQVCASGPPTANFTASSTTVVAGGTVNFTSTSLGGPSTWAWDLDGDGLIDSTASNPSFTYPNVGSYDVALTVSNSFGSDTLAVTGFINVVPLTPATLPYSQDFTAGLPPQGTWTYSSSNGSGVIDTGTSGTVSPVSGGPALRLYSANAGTYVTNDAVLHVDLAAAGGATLSYWYKETGDEDDPEDGVWLSDGTNTVLAQTHNAGPQTWTQFQIDITQVAASAGLALVPDFRIIFRQRDNYGLGTDGVLIDDIQVNTTFALVMTTTGAQDLYMEIVNMPAQAPRGLTLASMNTSFPVGQGTILGIRADAFTLAALATPPGPANPFHFVAPYIPGLYPVAPIVLPPGGLPFPVGTSMDFQVVVFGSSGAILDVTSVVRITF